MQKIIFGLLGLNLLSTSVWGIGYSIVNGKILNPDVFAWGHEDDSRPNVAPSLTQFVEGWKNGTITV